MSKKIPAAKLVAHALRNYAARLADAASTPNKVSKAEAQALDRALRSCSDISDIDVVWPRWYFIADEQGWLTDHEIKRVGRGYACAYTSMSGEPEDNALVEAAPETEHKLYAWAWGKERPLVGCTYAHVFVGKEGFDAPQLRKVKVLEVDDATRTCEICTISGVWSACVRWEHISPIV